MSNLNITIPLSDWQRTVLLDNHRFKVVCSGRQAGKSHMAAAYAIIKSLRTMNGVIWVLSPSFRQSGFLFDKIVSFCNDCKIPVIIKRSQQEMSIMFKITGSVVQAVSADDPDKLRGATLDAIIIDEAAMVKDGIFDEHIFPMLTVRKGECLFISTPKGKNWFYDIYTSTDEDFKSFHYTSADNPYISDKELERAARNTDALTYRQEYLAEFLDSGGVVFSHYATTDISKKPEDGHIYIAGLDLAKHVDYTVLTIADIDTKQIVDVLRFNDINWESQIFKIREYLSRYGNPIVYADSTGVGDPIVERLINEGIEARGVTFSSKSKQQMVQNLAVMLQREEVLLPNIQYYIDEFDRYSFMYTPSGQFKYSAPPGYHDDCVASLALLCWGLTKVASDVGFYYEDNEQPPELEEFDWSMDKFDWDTDDCMDTYETLDKHRIVSNLV